MDEMWAWLLLADASLCLRYLVLTELLGRSEDDKEVKELRCLRTDDALVRDLVATQADDGSWPAVDAVSAASLRTTATAQALVRLGYLGFDCRYDAVRRAAEYLFSRQGSDGSWPLPRQEHDEKNEGYSLVSLQTSVPLRGLAACGYSADARAERAYEWLLAQRLPDGAWPTGIAAGVYGYVAGYRKLPHSRWGCRSNTTAALICLSLHPTRCSKQPAQRALDLLLARETREQYALGCEVARMLGAERWRGFFTLFARFDLALILDLCWRIGAHSADPRVAEVAEFVGSLRGLYGAWEYPSAPQIARWVTFDIARSLSRVADSGAWVGREPRTPFRAYPKQRPRY